MLKNSKKLRRTMVTFLFLHKNDDHSMMTRYTSFLISKQKNKDHHSFHCSSLYQEDIFIVKGTSTLSLSLFSEENKFINGWNHRIINKEIYCEGNDNDPNYEKNRSIQRKCYFMTINVNLWPNFRESSDAIIIFNAGTNTTHNNKCHRIPDRYLQIKICGDVLFTFNRVNDRK